MDVQRFAWGLAAASHHLGSLFAPIGCACTAPRMMDMHGIAGWGREGGRGSRRVTRHGIHAQAPRCFAHTCASRCSRAGLRCTPGPACCMAGRCGGPPSAAARTPGPRSTGRFCCTARSARGTAPGPGMEDGGLAWDNGVHAPPELSTPLQPLGRAHQTRGLTEPLLRAPCRLCLTRFGHSGPQGGRCTS